MGDQAGEPDASLHIVASQVPTRGHSLLGQPRPQVGKGVIPGRDRGGQPVRVHDFPARHIGKKGRVERVMSADEIVRLGGVGKACHPQRFSPRKS
ncbi:MAG: Uncharacterised protein [Cellulomonadaceae bacterium TMED98]|nr:MAG: Uncharacterised protein [Cellulomonadaceae bacterium TMED98]